MSVVATGADILLSPLTPELAVARADGFLI